MYLELRLPQVTYLYDDPKHPDRRTGEVHSSPYTLDDRALLMALESYESTLCRCGVPIAIAWHSEMDGGFAEGTPTVCHFCTAAQGRQVVYVSNLRNTRDEATHGPMPAFVPGVTITAPDTGP